MKGTVVGLSSDSGIDALAVHYYMTMESIALQTKQIVDHMNASGHRIRSIFMSGSQCQNEILMHLITTSCEIPVVLPRYLHAAVVHGAAMLGARAATAAMNGNLEPLWTIMGRFTRPGDVVDPGTDSCEKKLLMAKYSIFLELGEQQVIYRRRVDEALQSS